MDEFSRIGEGHGQNSIEHVVRHMYSRLDDVRLQLDGHELECTIAVGWGTPVADSLEPNAALDIVLADPALAW